MLMAQFLVTAQKDIGDGEEGLSSVSLGIRWPPNSSLLHNIYGNRFLWVCVYKNAFPGEPETRKREQLVSKRDTLMRR